MVDKRSPGDIPRIDASDPLPAYQEPSSRWATPFITYRDGSPVHTVALRYGCALSSRERAAGLSAQLFADTAEDLQRLIEREDATRAALLRGGNGDES
ncbi:hypothetical protein OG979_17505 [Actinomadura citrea]|uniref:hypothetical protein n=1 Tax=Actinomadura citrea TaxID=46158 RepID=UPI002E27CC89|nr:hypothetical protein [Actinomadura citrea]